MNRFFKNMMMALAGLTVAAALWATPMTVNATRVLGSQSGGTATTQQTVDSGTTENTPAAELIGNGTVTADSVRVRKDATTSSDVVGKATQGNAVGVTGEKNDAEGMLWYAVTFESGGKTINGYIRSDLMSYEAIAAAETPEEAAPTEEAPAEEAPVVEQAPADDYYVQYTDDGTGTSDWYLFDQTMGKHYKVSELLSAQETSASNVEEMEGQVGTFRIIIVILAVVVLILIGVVTFLIIKLRNAGGDYEEYDDEDEEEDEEDEEEEEEEPVRRRGFFGRRRAEEDEDDEDEDDEEEEEEERPVRRAPSRRPANVRPSRRYEEEDEEEEDEEEEYQPRRTQKAGKNQKDKNWQSKNFLDDDDLEFEFLDLK